MITLAIIAILAAIAYPSYTVYIKRSQRAAARSQLLQAEQYMKRFYAANDSYSTDRGGTAGVELYAITVSASTDTSFTVSATPAGSMTGDICGTFTIDQTGRKGVLNNNETRDACWR